MQVSDWTQTEHDGRVSHRGLKFTVDVSSTGFPQAIQLARVEVARINDELSAAHSCAIQDPQPTFAFNWDASVPDREFVQVLSNAPELRKLFRTFDDDAFRPYFARRDEHRSAHPREARRVDRALRYLRSSLLETDPIDRFEDLWVGLEAINPLIREKYSLGTTFVRKCGECDTPLRCAECDTHVRAPDNASGIDFVVTDLLSRSPDLARHLRRTRIDLSHSRRDLHEVLPHLVDLTALARQALRAGILNVLGVDEDWTASFLMRPLELAEQPLFVVHGILRGLSVEQLRGMPRYPLLTLEGVETAITGRDETEPHPTHLAAVQLLVRMTDYDGPWEHLAIYGDIAQDPEVEAPAPSVLLRTLPNTAPTENGSDAP